MTGSIVVVGSGGGLTLNPVNGDGLSLTHTPDNDLTLNPVSGDGLSLTHTPDNDLTLNSGGVVYDGLKFLPVPDIIDDNDMFYFYFGWYDVLGSWLIRRQLRSSASMTDAGFSENGSYPDLSTAWDDRETLIYI